MKGKREEDLPRKKQTLRWAGKKKLRRARQLAPSLPPPADSEETTRINYHLRRLTIAYLYLEVLGMPPMEDWGSPGTNDGAIAFVRRTLAMPVKSSQNI